MKTKKQRQLVRDALVERDGSCCHYCGKKLRTKTRAKRLPTNYCHIEHVVPQEHGGSNELSNLVLSCKRCNTDKSTKDYASFIQSELDRVTVHYNTLVERSRKLSEAPQGPSGLPTYLNNPTGSPEPFMEENENV